MHRILVGYGAAASPACKTSTVVRRQPPYIMDNLFFGTPLKLIRFSLGSYVDLYESFVTTSVRIVVRNIGILAYHPKAN